MEMNTQMQPAPLTAPPTRPDQRPAADAAALARAPRPDVPLPIPPNNGQIAAISQSLMPTRPDARDESSIAAVSASQRTLKPYGITMLPQPPGETDTARNR